MMGLSIPEVARVDLEWQARLEFDYSEWVDTASFDGKGH